jgi:hypothetical protein
MPTAETAKPMEENALLSEMLKVFGLRLDVDGTYTFDMEWFGFTGEDGGDDRVYALEILLSGGESCLLIDPKMPPPWEMFLEIDHYTQQIKFNSENPLNAQFFECDIRRRPKLSAISSADGTVDWDSPYTVFQWSKSRHLVSSIVGFREKRFSISDAEGFKF